MIYSRATSEKWYERADVNSALEILESIIPGYSDSIFETIFELPPPWMYPPSDNSAENSHHTALDYSDRRLDSQHCRFAVLRPSPLRILGVVLHRAGLSDIVSRRRSLRPST
jgi:hypothetical protein